MKTLLRLALLLVLCQIVLGQSANVPVCNGSNGPNCTDYFGVANWANSPLPAGSVTAVTLVAGGSNYVAPTVQITDLANPANTSANASVAVNLAIGIGLMVFLHALVRNTPVFYVGLIPGLIGVALLLYHYLLRPRVEP